MAKEIQPHREGKKLTRAGMEAVIREGGSVHYRGRIIADIAQLPSDMELLDGQIEDLEQLRGTLEADEIF